MRFVSVLALCSALCIPTLAFAATSNLAQYLDPIMIGEQPTIGSDTIITPDLVIAAYQANNFDAIWQDQDYALQAIELLKQAELEGLNPQDYHLQALQELLQQDDSAQFDVLMTDAVMTYATHLIRGKVNPKSLTKTWNYDQHDVTPDQAAAALLKHVKAQTLAEGLENLKPQIPHYKRLKDGLVFYKKLQTLKPLPQASLAKGVIRPTETDPSIPVIRRRLERLGYYTGELNDENLTYDKPLQEAVEKLQYFNQVKTDGVIGKDTLKLLNQSYQEKINDIIVNLERTRWVDNNLTEDFLIVNIAGFKVFLMKNGKLKWESNVVVGRNYTKTPIFKGRLSYVVINPTWTVPRSITKGLVDKVKANPNYLEEKNFYLVDAKRNPIDAQSIDWDSVNRNKFPYWFVQGPSENNSLGQVKFMFPNKYSVYLHDTPAKTLFAEDQRAFSHGCVRVENPFDLAEHVLANTNSWSRNKIDETLASKETTRVTLDKPLDVLLMYWTVAGNEDGLHFYSDVYNRDPALLAKLTQ
ncbi:L,D-transpeptidase family protein [Pseudoalteromonas sp. YIC-656]|uniref:L,D-transpeptidase family protein n=1 Tax=Pseudoalteromonas pernae TaxID=3118054 RepID=UPI0032429D8D